MKPSVAAVFTAYQTKFEGCLPFLYLDVKGLVTCAIGLLVDPVDAALMLPWQIGDYPAVEEEVRNQWQCVKDHQDWKLRGGGAFGSLTTIRLSPTSIDQVTLAKAAQMETVLRRYFPSYDSVPADAQLGLLSMSWALGPAFSPRWPMFTNAFRTGDWSGCADQCALSTAGNPGVAPRNDACRKLFLAASTTEDEEAVTGWP